ncbi:MAG: hypothetical protein ABIG32_01920 [Candidatus Uhrbacteria bacterium]
MDGGFVDYQAPELETQEKRYKLSLLWVENRALLGKILLGIWAAVDVILIIFALVVMVDAFLISYEVERALGLGFGLNQANLHELTLANAAGPVRLSNTEVFVLGDGRYDFYATIANENENHWLEFDYHFEYGNVVTESKRGFVYPLETKPVVEFAYEADSRPSGAKVVIENENWNFISPHLIADFQQWKDDRIGFTISNASYTASIDELEKSVGRSTFTVRNSTAYGYWEPAFYILLYRGASPVAITRTTIDQFEPGAERVVETNWFGTLSAVNTVEVIPEIDLLDISVYMPLTGETGLDTRNRVFERR